jgi:hypothetical protein
MSIPISTWTTRRDHQEFLGRLGLSLHIVCHNTTSAAAAIITDSINRLVQCMNVYTTCHYTFNFALNSNKIFGIKYLLTSTIS